MKNLFVITDPGLDPDDLVNAWLLANLQKQGALRVSGMTANFSPSMQRARLLKGVLNGLGVDVPVACGTDCNSTHKVRDYEFDFALANEQEIVLINLLSETLFYASDKSVTLQLISGLTDIAIAIESFPDLLMRKVKEVYIMGGATWENDYMTGRGGETFENWKLIADPTASNNRFDQTLNPQMVYDFFVNNQIPLRVLTRYAAYAAGVTPEFYDEVQSVNTLGKHLHTIQEASLKSLWQFANGNPPEHRQNRQWFSKTFCGMDDVPISADESPWQFLKKLSLYDPLTSVWMVRPELFNPSSHMINGVEHQIVGLSADETGVIDPDGAIAFLKQTLLS